MGKENKTETAAAAPEAPQEVTPWMIKARKREAEIAFDVNWQPLRDRLSLKDCSLLNTYITTHDLACLNALFLNLLAQRDELLAAAKDGLRAMRSLGWDTATVNPLRASYDYAVAAIANAEKGSK